jgi:hypothetical protein
MSLVDRAGDNPTTPENVDKIKKTNSVFWKIRIAFYVILILVVVWIFATAFYSKSHTIYVDNPTWTWITFKIWDKIQEKLEPYSHKSINISPWKYDLVVDWKNIWSFEKKYLEWNTFLNPTQDIYIQEYTLYWDEVGFDKLPNNHIEVFWNKIEWPFKSYSWIYIDWDWNYDLDEAFPSEVKLKKWKDYSIKSKIYRFDEFAQMYNESYANTGSWSWEYSENDYTSRSLNLRNINEFLNCNLNMRI